MEGGILTDREKNILLHLCRRHRATGTTDEIFALAVVETCGAYSMATLAALQFCENYMRVIRNKRIRDERLM